MELTDAQCNELRCMPVPFNDMIKAVYNAGVRKETERCWKAIDDMIIIGPLSGNGGDKSAERNGLVMACNVLSSWMDF